MHSQSQRPRLASACTSLLPKARKFCLPILRKSASLGCVLDRCIFCELCVRASRAEGKNAFAGRGIHTRLVVNSPTGSLGDSALEAKDLAARICPMGVLVLKEQGFRFPIGQRCYDGKSFAEVSVEQEAFLVRKKWESRES